MSTLVAQVIVDVPVSRTNRPFDYVVPEWLVPLAAVGSRVVVPFGPRKLQGYIINLYDEAAETGFGSGASDVRKLKEIIQVQDDTPPLTGELIELAQWMSH
ncbi:MAG: primosomal protein N', partial [Clostridia bacterium]